MQTRRSEGNEIDNLEKRAINLSLRLSYLNTDIATILKSPAQHSKGLVLKENRITFTPFLRKAKKNSNEVNQLVDKIQKEALILLNDIEHYLQENRLIKTSNPHINYFLTMAARYNGFFLEVSQPTSSSIKIQHPLHALDILNAAAFSHPLLGNANHISISYKKDVTKGRFRLPIIKEDRGRRRFYYNEKESGPSFLDKYLAANKKIGQDTLTSNFLGFFFTFSNSTRKR